MSRAAIFLLVVGLLQMTGDLMRLPALRAIAAATGASPAPKVFSSVQRLETFSSVFYLEWHDRDGTGHSLELSPELYSRVRGPYNRRNVFGAALAYAPILSADPRTKPMYEAVVRYALCSHAPLLLELGIDPASLAAPPNIRLLVRSESQFSQSEFLIAPSCQ
jgi:hypothetical protein